MGKHIITKIKEELQKMSKSRDTGYIKTYIPWDNDRGFSVECIRDDEDSKIYDEDGNLLDDRTGVTLEYQIYYQINGKDFDCCTLTSALSAKDMQDLEEFVKMYR